MLVVPNEGELIALRTFLNNTAAQDQVLKLYTNNITPADGDTAATYSVYSVTKNLTGASWVFTTEASYPEQLFTFTSYNAFYGYIVVNTSGTLLWAERFTNAPFVVNNGDEIRINLVLGAE